MAIVSRLLLNHPALSTAGGAGLHTSIQDLYVKIGDNMSSRFFLAENLTNGSNIDLEHNFKSAFRTLRYDLYLWDSGTEELTLVSETDLLNYTIIPTPSFTTTKIRVTNNSGSTQDLVLVVHHQMMSSKKVDFVTLDVAGNITLVEGKYHLVDTSAARSLTLPSPSGTYRPIWIKDKTGSASTNNITVVRAGSEKIETVAASYALDSDLGAWCLVNDGTDWFII